MVESLQQYSTLYQRIRAVLADATALAFAAAALPQALSADEVPLERPRQTAHGDLATNLCFAMAKTAKQNPRAMAETFLKYLDLADITHLIASAEVAGPGFVNLHLAPPAWQAALRDCSQAAELYGQSRIGGGESILLEFVSANPTGPMHVGHGRGAVLGDSLARVLRSAGYAVHTEYYVNNVGNQIAKLGESVWHWLRDPVKRAQALATWELGEAVVFPDGFPSGFPDDGYRGAYIAEAAATMAATAPPPVHDAAESWSDDAGWLAVDRDSATGRADNRSVSVRAWQVMLTRIREDLALLNIEFDQWFSERRLHGLDAGSSNAVADVCRRLQAVDWAYEEQATATDDEEEATPGRAVFFRGTSETMPKAFRDTKDRVILRGDGRPTYFAADIAYHDDKLARGHDHLINVLGADHHGYVSRLKGVLQALGELRTREGDANGARWSGDRLEVLLVQMVALLRDGKPVPMGKRSGEFVTLREVIDEVTTDVPTSGRDAVRFLFLTRKADAQLDFDLAVAKKTSMDNLVYYVQYCHARLASILARAQAEGRGLRDGASLSALKLDDERDLAMIIADYPEVLARAARNREPHLVAYYTLDICRAFHAYYTKGKVDARVISDDVATTQSRLALVAALKQTLANALTVLGVSAPDRMQALPESDPLQLART